jgi:serine-threonine kinase receptor-associated protein
MAPAEVTASSTGRQIPIVCPGHTRPLAELQFCAVQEDGCTRTFLVSACHGRLLFSI